MSSKPGTQTEGRSPRTLLRPHFPRVLVLPLVIFVFAISPVSAVEAKVGLNRLSAAQQKQLRKNIGTYAKYEAFLNYCESTSRVERRIWAVAGPCVKRDSLNKVSSYFRRKLREHAKRFPSKAMIEQNSTYRCDRKKNATLIKKIKGLFNTIVGDIDRMCRLCFFC